MSQLLDNEPLSLLIALCLLLLALTPSLRRAHRNRLVVRNLARVGSEAISIIRSKQS
jgi:hypothetical protein